MTATARALPATSILRTASGEPPLGADGEAFRFDQGEMLKPHDLAYQSHATRIGVLELNNGHWLSFPYGVDRPQYPTRDAALRAGIAALIRKSRRYMRVMGQGTQWTEGYAGRVIEWALSIKPGKDLVHRAAAIASAVIIQPGEVQTAPHQGEVTCDHSSSDVAATDQRLIGQASEFPAATSTPPRKSQGSAGPSSKPTPSASSPKTTPTQSGSDSACSGCRPASLPQRIFESGVGPDAANPRQSHLQGVTGGESASTFSNPGEPIADAGVTDDGCRGRDGEVNQPTSTDPVVAMLVTAHRQRLTYPAGHTFAMTNPIINGQMVTLGTCSCGDSFSYTYGSYERMDAAIEAHWQKFDASPDKVDGRGQPINEINAQDRAAAPPKERRRRRSRNGVAGQGAKAPADPGLAADTALPAPASDTLSVDGAGAPLIEHGADEYQAPLDPATSLPPEVAGSTLSTHDAGGQKPASEPALSIALDGAGEIQAAQICAGDDPFWDSPLIKAAIDLAWWEPPQVSDQLARLLDFSKVYGPPSGKLRGPVGNVERPVLRWYGGKWRLAPWIMGFFPEHRIYVEPFGGAGSVLMRKPRVYAEIYNDLDDVVVNLFRVLRDETKAARLIEVLRLTPFSRAEFNEALLEAEDDIERARHLVVRSYMGFGSNAHSSSSTAEKTGFKSFSMPDNNRSTGFRANSNRSGTTPGHDWANYPDALPSIIDRLSGVIVDQRPAIDVMKQNDGPATLHYVDPPYLPETRSPANKYDLKHRMYRHELTVDDHRELLAFLQTLKGFVVLSGCPSEMYDEALPDWRRETCSAMADGARERTEVVWINPACAAALDALHPTLFNVAALDAVNTPPLNEMTEANDAV